MAPPPQMEAFDVQVGRAHYHFNGVNKRVTRTYEKTDFDREVEQAQVGSEANGFHPEVEEHLETEGITDDQIAEISQLIGRQAAHSTLEATSSIWREGGFDRYRQRERSQSPDP